MASVEAASRREETSDDMELVRRAVQREPHAVRAIMTRNNQRLYRMARSILRNDSEAEDVLQEAWLRVFAKLDEFRGESALATWMSRIVINEALGRLRRKRRAAFTGFQGERGPGADVIPFPLNSAADDPERNMAQRQILSFVEQATDSLPEAFRTVFVARVIEGLSVDETAEVLGIKPETVKTRLHRARKLLRERLEEQIGPVLLDAFPFAGHRCERVTAAVMARLGIAD